MLGAVPLVLFEIMFPGLVPEDVPDEARAVRAAAYIYIDHAHGGFGAVVRADLNGGDIHPLAMFPVGAEVFIEGTRSENLDDDDTTGGSRIWWRGLLVGPMVRGGSS